MLTSGGIHELMSLPEVPGSEMRELVAGTLRRYAAAGVGAGGEGGGAGGAGVGGGGRGAGKGVVALEFVRACEEKVFCVLERMQLMYAILTYADVC
jgi:hypothetical protein